MNMLLLTRKFYQGRRNLSEQHGRVDLARHVAVLEERMNTITESYDRGWQLLEARIGKDNARLEARIGKDNAKRDTEFAKLREDNARFREDIAKRDTANTRWLIGFISAASAIVIAVVISTS